ncbi:MAG: hydroxymethylglutaryl-CoA synthase, partial [Candidatus Helarchaeota archaeon]
MPGSGIVGYGLYLPYYRIKLTEIAEAWNRNIKSAAEKTVPAPDETPLTMGRNAVDNAIAHANISPTEIGAIYLCSNSSMIEGSYAQDVAIAAGVEPDVMIADLHGSPRSFTTAIMMCLDAINSNRINYGLVVGTDILVGGPGTNAGDIGSEYISAAGAGALILGTEGVITELEAQTSYMTGMKERWRNLADKFPRVGDGRFIRDVGYLAHIIQAGKTILEKTSRSIIDYTHVLLQQPHGQWVKRALSKLGVPRDQVKAKMAGPGIHINKFGDLGAACLPVGLAEILEHGQPEELILTISYGAGGSDALSWIIRSAITEKRGRAVSIEKYQKNKEYINYT